MGAHGRNLRHLRLAKVKAYLKLLDMSLCGLCVPGGSKRGVARGGKRGDGTKGE